MKPSDFLAKPSDLGITSCLHQGKLDILFNENLIDIMNVLRSTDDEDIVNSVMRGEFCINKFTTSRFGYRDNYKINDNWRLKLTRVSKDLYAFIIEPTNTHDLLVQREGLRTLASEVIKDREQLTFWLDYPHFSKLFYLQEFAKVIDDPIQFNAMLNYDDSFSKEEYYKWIKDYEWNIGYTHPLFRKYLKRHVDYVIGRLNKA